MNIKAYAKINLGLRILNKRPDGYHNIETIFHRINLFDELILKESENISLKCENPEIPTDERNLCIKTARLILKKYPVKKGVDIQLKKNIPIGAGLGGGSSDAAAVLLHLPKLWEIEIDKNEMRELASQIGSDVPYFLENGSAYATGRGEILEYFDPDMPYWILVVTPEIHVSTLWAYRNIELQPIQNESTLKEIIKSGIQNIEQLKDILRNDFEDLVFDNYPEINEIKKKLYDYGADFVQMSGSGSAVFGIFKNKYEVQSANKLLSKKYKTYVTEPHFNPEF